MYPSVLVVEDNFDNQQLTSWILEDNGYSVCCTDSAEEALELLELNRFDIILMDVHLPGMDGKEATRKIRGAEHLKDIPVIALTAHVMQSELESIAESGVDDILTKPFDEQILISLLSQLLTQARPKMDIPGTRLNA